MKILIGILLAALLALWLAGWQLASSLEREGETAKQLGLVQASSKVLETQNRELLDRFGSLDSVMTSLNQAQAVNQLELLGRLKAITKIVKETGDSDETIQCVDLPVPAQLDRRLREPTPAGG